MPNLWTGLGAPYTRDEIRERLQVILVRGESMIAAGAGNGIRAKFIGDTLCVSLRVVVSRVKMASHGWNLKTRHNHDPHLSMR